MSSGPTVSVLVPCFRSAGFLRRALDSLLAQTFSDWEAVVVDNASDDATHALALEYAGRDPRFRAFRNVENVGPVRNWRRCAELARAPLAGLLFADDWYAPGFLAAAVPLLAAPDVAFVYSAVRVVKAGDAADGAPVQYALPGGAVIRASADFLRASYGALTKAHVPVSPGCALFRREELARFLGAAPPQGEEGWLSHGAGPDVMVYLQACLTRPRFAHLAEPHVYFLSHGDNLSWRPDVARAYAVALAAFLPHAERRMGLTATAKARARLVDRLAGVGEAERSRELARNLGLLGRYKLARQRRRAARA